MKADPTSSTRTHTHVDVAWSSIGCGTSEAARSPNGGTRHPLSPFWGRVISTSRWDPDDDPAERLLERFGRVGNVLGWVFLPFIAASAVMGLWFADNLGALLATGLLWWGGGVSIVLRTTRRGWGRPPPQVSKRPVEGKELEEFRHMMRGHTWRSWRAGSYFFMGLAMLYGAVGAFAADRREVLLSCVAVWVALALLCAYLSWATLCKYRRGLQDPA